MTKIAIIADIHGNKEALKTVLNDVKQRNCDQIICLGDIISKGNFSKECVDLVQEHCDVVLKGNCEDYVTKDHDFSKLSQKEQQRILTNREELTPNQLEYLSKLPCCHEFYMSGRLVRVFHAGPDSLYNYSNTSMIASIDKKYQMFEPNVLTLSDKVADLVVYGHIHTQFMNKLYHRTLVCCGSVGNNLDYVRNEDRDGNVLHTTCVNYVILEGECNAREQHALDIDFVQVPYDIEKELADSEDMIEGDSLRYELMHGTYRDSKKLKQIISKEGIDLDHHS